MIADPFLRELLDQAIERASSRHVQPPVRLAMARLVAHLLREFHTEIDERMITVVLEGIRRNFDQYAVVVVLSRALWLVAPDERRLFVAYRRLARVAFDEGHKSSLSELVALLCLSRGEEPLPEEWGREAVIGCTTYGAGPRVARLITRWLKAFEITPPWLRDLVHDPEVLCLLAGDVVETIHRRRPTAATWRDLARRSHASSSPPNFETQSPEAARDELALALEQETSGPERITLARWSVESAE